MTEETPSHGDVQTHYRAAFARAEETPTNPASCSGQEEEDPDANRAVDVYATPYHNEILAKLDPSITRANFGCGAPIPAGDLTGMTVVDLGCGHGRDVYVLSALVGEEGHVIGVDMIAEVLERAGENREVMREAFGFSESNVQFELSKIEEMSAIDDNSVDLVVSNCVINLSPSKERVFAEISRILKPGGELFFADIYCSVRMPDALTRNKDLWGACYSGGMYLPDFESALRKVGMSKFHIVRGRLVDTPAVATELVASHPELMKALKFYSFTMRAFKLPEVEEGEEPLYEGIESNFGQTVTFLGDKYGDTFEFDYVMKFQKGRPYAVSGDDAELISKSRYSRFFEITERGDHLGRFGDDRPYTYWEMVDEIEKGGVKSMTSACCAPGQSEAEGGSGSCCGGGGCGGGEKEEGGE